MSFEVVGGKFVSARIISKQAKFRSEDVGYIDGILERVLWKWCIISY